MPFLMAATVIQAIMSKAPTMKPSPHASMMKPSSVLPSRQWPSKETLRRARLWVSTTRRSGEDASTGAMTVSKFGAEWSVEHATSSGAFVAFREFHRDKYEGDIEIRDGWAGNNNRRMNSQVGNEAFAVNGGICVSRIKAERLRLGGWVVACRCCDVGY